MKHLLLIGMLLFVTSCNQNSNKTPKAISSPKSTDQPVGGQKDAHGCLTAAGETWSALLQDCVKVFAVGIRLNPTTPDPNNSAVLSAFIIFNPEHTKAELFLPVENKTPKLLELTKSEEFKNNNFTFDNNSGTLYNNGKLIYKIEIKTD
ncbi:hypothetical protein [Formosa sp. A9]|uniref:hypothetical protein n=1 Tax=Formosa sp. A9 TaxID=3442641 RepID=UPI003EBFC477